MAINSLYMNGELYVNPSIKNAKVLALDKKNDGLTEYYINRGSDNKAALIVGSEKTDITQFNHDIVTRTVLGETEYNGELYYCLIHNLSISGGDFDLCYWVKASDVTLEN